MRAAADNAVVGQTVVDLLRDHDSGRTEKKITEAVRKVIAGVVEHRKDGNLSININVAPVKGGVDRLWITVKTKVNAPEAPPPSDVRYADEQGNLFDRDPKQMELLGD